MTDSTTKTQLCDDCRAPLEVHLQGFCPHEINTGEKVMYSEMTDTWYLATKWVDRGENKHITISKREISENRAQELVFDE